MSTASLAVRDRSLVAPLETLATPPGFGPYALPVDLPGVDDDGGAFAVLDQADQLATTYPTSPTAVARLAQAQLVSGRTRSAPSTARRALRLAVEQWDEDRDLGALAAAACVLIATGNAHESLKALVDIDHPAVAHLAARGAIEAGDYELASVMAQRSSDPASLALRGWLSIRAGKFSEGIHTFRTIVQQGHATPDVFTNLGYAYAAVGSAAKFRKATLTALAMSPGHRTATFNLTASFMGEGDLDSGLRLLRQLRAFYPGSMQIRFGMAEILRRQGRSDRAIQELRSARTELSESSPAEAIAELEANLAILRLDTHMIDADEATATLDECLEQTEYRNLGVASMRYRFWRQTTDLDAATACFDRLAAIHPPNALRQFAQNIAFLGLDFSVATQIAREWFEAEPLEPAAAVHLTYLLIEHVQAYDEAAELGSRVLRCYPADPILRNNVAYALARAGRLDEARRTLPIEGNDMYVAATRALIDALSGQVELARTGYDSARKQASEENDGGLLADLISLHQALSFKWVSARNDIPVEDILRRRSTDPRVVLIGRQLVSN